MKRRTAIAALSTAALLAWLPAARSADTIDVLNVGIEPSTDGEAWLLSADFSLALTPQLEDAVNKGVPLYFLVEFELLRPRWYWCCLPAPCRRGSSAAMQRPWLLPAHCLPR